MDKPTRTSLPRTLDEVKKKVCDNPIKQAIKQKAEEYIHKNLPDPEYIHRITGRTFYVPRSKKLKDAMLTAAREAVGEREDVWIKLNTSYYIDELPKMFAEELCSRLQKRYNLPFMPFYDATNNRLFTVAIHPDEREWEGWEVVNRDMRYDRMFLTELRTVVIRKDKTELHLEQQYVEIGNTFVLAWVIVSRHHA